MTLSVTSQESGEEVRRVKAKNDYYKCGLLKWSKTPLLSRVSLLVSALALAVSLLARYKTG